ncbi:MAG: hypothetical protein JNL92_03185 [Opitutaceae bacterium]|nr:hypothetical protein [Opitutaceae bacterium]
MLREQARHAEAEAVQREELAPLLDVVRAGEDDPLTLDARLAATMAEETERVTNAMLLAELLAPLLGGRARADDVTVTAVAARPAPLPLAQPVPASRPAPVRAAVSIADFLDEMIAQESTPARPNGPAQRRAS